eukprot:m.77101 g.77101  ORF g.77101 m.77101 type:complete len:310 (-) comp17263_c0_seq5:143-1072(-)
MGNLFAAPDAGEAAAMASLAADDAQLELRAKVQAFGKRVGPTTRLPLTISTAMLDPALLQHLLTCSIFHLPEGKLIKNGFTRNVDHPSVPGHIYYEGYFHGLQSTKPVTSINPRLGHNFAKPAGPLPLRAFTEAFRRINDDLVRRALRIGQPQAALASLYERGWQFADLAVQIHAADRIGPEKVGWHIDAFNSMLHLAVSLQGRRALHVEHVPDPAQTEGEKHSYWQAPGDVYLSLPNAFGHGVEYSETAWDSRIIAVQIRFLMTEEDFAMQLQDLTPTVESVAAVLAEGNFRLPTLQEVLAVEKEWGK